MSGPITQTSPDTEREGRQDKIHKNHPQPSPRKTKQTRNTPSRKKPDQKLGKRRVVENPTPKVQENVKKQNIDCSREAKVCYPRWRLEILLRYAGPRSKHASQVNLQTPRTSYSSRRNRVARQRKRKFDRSRVVHKSNQIYSIRWCSRADFPEPPQTVVALVQKMGPVGKCGVAVLAKPVGVRDAAIDGCQKPLAVTPIKLPWCRADSHPVEQAVGLAVLFFGVPAQWGKISWRES